jgi:hypothetical protein
MKGSLFISSIVVCYMARSAMGIVYTKNDDPSPKSPTWKIFYLMRINYYDGHFPSVSNFPGMIRQKKCHLPNELRALLTMFITTILQDVFYNVVVNN